jgi:hypothetical protein
LNLYCGVAEDKLKALREKLKEAPKQEPTTEMLFLCSYEGCHKTFLEATQIRKHMQVHGERQYVCHFDGCGKVFFLLNINIVTLLCSHLSLSLVQEVLVCTFVAKANNPGAESESIFEAK